MLCYSISTYTNNLKTNEENLKKLSESIKTKIMRYCNVFFSDQGLNYMNSLNLSLLCLAINRINYSDKDVLILIIENLIMMKDKLTEDNIDEICKIIWTFSKMGYNNPKIGEFLLDFLLANKASISPSQAIDLYLSVTTIFINNEKLINELVDILTARSPTNDRNLNESIDITSYVSLWVNLTNYSVKVKPSNVEEILVKMVGFLFSIYERQLYL
jgi:hypothetical protein